MMNHPLMIALLLMQISTSPQQRSHSWFSFFFHFICAQISHLTEKSCREKHTQTLSRPYAQRNALLLMATY